MPWDFYGVRKRNFLYSPLHGKVYNMILSMRSISVLFILSLFSWYFLIQNCRIVVPPQHRFQNGLVYSETNISEHFGTRLFGQCCTLCGMMLENHQEDKDWHLNVTVSDILILVIENNVREKGFSCIIASFKRCGVWKLSSVTKFSSFRKRKSLVYFKLKHKNNDFQASSTFNS